MLDELRDQFPAQIAEAETVLRTRESVLDEGREEADRILEQARRERSKLVAKTEVVRAATEDADRIILEAQTETDRMRVEVDEYVDTKLANFEVVLGKTLAAVERGREKLRGRHPLDDLRETSPDERPLPG